MMDEFWEKFNAFVNPDNLVLTPYGVDEEGRKVFRGTQILKDGSFVEVIIHKPNENIQNVEE